MKKHILFLITCGLLSTHALFAQMSINTTGTQADPSAGLDVDFSNKGLLIPRIALSSKTDATTIPNPATGLMVYNTGTGGLSLAGYYYNAGTSSSPNWVHLSTTGLDGSGEATQVAFWTGTNTLSSNANLYWDNTNSRLGIGTSTPATNLEINGNVLATAFKGTGNYQSVWSSWGNSIWLEKNSTDAIFYNDPASSKGFMIGFHGVNDRIYIGHTTDSWSSGSYLGIIDGEGRVGIRTDPNNSYSLYVDGKGSTTAVRGIYNSTKFGDLETADYGVYGQSSADIKGYLGGDNGAYGQYSSSIYGMLGHESYGAYGKNGDHLGYLGSSNYGVYGKYSDDIYGYIGGSNYGVYGQYNGNIKGRIGDSKNGVYGQYSSTRYGMLGNENYGVYGKYDNSIYGYIGGATYAIYGTGGTYAGYFNGNVRVTGTLTKGGGSFLIDHPLDPLNKTLRHNFVESTWNMCVYPGKVKLDESGVAKVIMPDYYAALVKEAEAIAQITPVGRPFLTGCEWSEDFSTLIIYGEPDREVYYTVMADRDDPVIHLLAKPIEEEKGNGNFTKGKLLYPEAYGYPETMGEDYQSPDD
ncbi:MAG: hypothetical protein KBG25_06055 [Paludibacteraceae bacterium]|nr:hypothetical protein [Paludibacteraceae bacterium]